jgi:hypothetical protein
LVQERVWFERFFVNADFAYYWGDEKVPDKEKFA